MATVTGICFVVMGFGKKTDFETGRTLDLDKSYKNMIKPAVEASGLKCVRADEIVHSGLIDVPMYEQLLNADVVVADLSTSNKNAFYELGVRHALRPHTTLVIAEDGIKAFPFDVSHVAVRQYHHLGADIGFDEVMRFRELLTAAINELMNRNPRQNDSPVYTFLDHLTPPIIALSATRPTSSEKTTVDVAIAPAAVSGQTLIASTVDTTTAMASTHAMLMQQIDDAEDKGDFVAAKNLLSCVRQVIKTEAPDKGENLYITQRLALATAKSKYPSEEAALKEARDLLVVFDPKTSNDTETLGLWGSIHKRLWNFTKNPADLDKAVRAYGRGLYLRNDHYNGINLAYLLNVRAAQATDLADAIADFVLARRVRKEVISICEEWLGSNPIPDSPSASLEAMEHYLESRYWVMATMAEAYLGLEDEAKAQQIFKDAESVGPPESMKDLTKEQLEKIRPPEWMKQSTREQMAKLKPLLDRSPLSSIKSHTLER